MTLSKKCIPYYPAAADTCKEIEDFVLELQQMILTKKQYQKTGGYIAWHGYQSFKPDEVTPKQCHEIGLKLAGEMWGDKYKIIVVTHLDRGHLHNHFCFNSVSYLDGKSGKPTSPLMKEELWKLDEITAST